MLCRLGSGARGKTVTRRFARMTNVRLNARVTRQTLWKTRASWTLLATCTGDPYQPALCTCQVPSLFPVPRAALAT